MRKRYFVLLFLGIILFQSCEKEDIDIFHQDYFYYTFDFEKIQLYLLGSQVFLEFNSHHSEEEILKFINDYSFFNVATPIISSFDNIIRCQLNQKDTIKLKEILLDLNQDTSINYAVPVFTFKRNDDASYIIAINEIVCDPLVSNGELNKLINPYNLTVLDSKPESFYYRYKINNIKTGFEPLNIANSLYETKKFHYCTPNFYAAIVH
mgnify:CR=1 FL=1